MRSRSHSPVFFSLKFLGCTRYEIFGWLNIQVDNPALFKSGVRSETRYFKPEAGYSAKYPVSSKENSQISGWVGIGYPAFRLAN